MTRTEKTLKSQLNAARSEIEDLYLALEELKEREKIYLARIKDQNQPARRMTLADFGEPLRGSAADSVIDLERVEAAL